MGKISQSCSSQVHKHTLTPILFYSFYRDIYLISVYRLTLWGDPIIWIKWKLQSVFQQKGGKSYIVHESTYKYKCLWGHHLWACTCINQCSLSECHCVFLFLCEFLLPGVMFLKPGQPFTPTGEQGQAYPWAPVCVVMCVPCVCVFIAMHRCTTLWHLPSAFSSLSWFYMWMHCCVSKTVCCPVCLFSPEPAIGLFQTEMLHSDVFFLPRSESS